MDFILDTHEEDLMIKVGQELIRKYDLDSSVASELAEELLIYMNITGGNLSVLKRYLNH